MSRIKRCYSGRGLILIWKREKENISNDMPSLLERSTLKMDPPIKEASKMYPSCMSLVTPRGISTHRSFFPMMSQSKGKTTRLRNRITISRLNKVHKMLELKGCDKFNLQADHETSILWKERMWQGSSKSIACLHTNQNLASLSCSPLCITYYTPKEALFLWWASQGEH